MLTKLESSAKSRTLCFVANKMSLVHWGYQLYVCHSHWIFICVLQALVPNLIELLLFSMFAQVININTVQVLSEFAWAAKCVKLLLFTGFA